LTDPENLEEWTEEVWASTLEGARQRCQQLAGELTEVLNVTQKNKTPSRGGNYRFICWFRTEVIGDDGDSDNPGN
jgi:hypothetical protein